VKRLRHRGRDIRSSTHLVSETFVVRSEKVSVTTPLDLYACFLVAARYTRIEVDRAATND
jgi:hypothetical protein